MKKPSRNISLSALAFATAIWCVVAAALAIAPRFLFPHAPPDPLYPDASAPDMNQGFDVYSDADGRLSLRPSRDLYRDSMQTPIGSIATWLQLEPAESSDFIPFVVSGAVQWRARYVGGYTVQWMDAAMRHHGQQLPREIDELLSDRLPFNSYSLVTISMPRTGETITVLWWPGIVIAISQWIAIIIVLIQTKTVAVSVRAWWNVPDGVCAKCRYPRVEGVNCCPECGTEYREVHGPV